MRRAAGFTLIELVVVMAVMGLLLLVLAALLRHGVDVWTRVTGADDTQSKLRKAVLELREDLLDAAFDDVQTLPVPASLVASDGDAVWFRSAVNPATGQFMRKADGSPFWQRNLLFYLVVSAGDPCGGGAGPGGYDDRCPHKVLLRKLIDEPGEATDPSDENTEEALIADISPYLTRPAGLDVTVMAGEPGVEEVQVVASNLLMFNAVKAPAPNLPREVMVDVRAVPLREAQRKVRVGAHPLAGDPLTDGVVVSIFPRN